MVIHLLIGLLATLVVLWVVFACVLFAAAPDSATIGEAVRLIPDVLRLIGRLARDRSLSRGVRVRLWLLVVYLALPIDLMPDFIPVLGYADDVVITALVLRWFVRHVGADKLAEHWPGTPDGLLRTKAVLRIAEPR